MTKEFAHLDDKGRPKMVDIADKAVTKREAAAEAVIRMDPSTIDLIRKGGHVKGDVLSAAQTAGIMAAKRTPDLIPMCHPLEITGVDIDFRFLDESAVTVTAVVRNIGRTGVEMEALTAAGVAALTVYDMCKSVQKDIVIERIRLLRKSGGGSGEYKCK